MLKTYRTYIVQFKPVLSIGTSSTKQANQRLFASWVLVGGRLEGDKPAPYSV